MKSCSKCHISKELELFNKDKSSKDGHRSDCKECSRLYRIENSDKLKKYREDNKDKSSKRWKDKYYSNKDVYSDINKKYYQLNKEKIKEKSKEYYLNNKGVKIEYQKEYQQNNKEKRNKYLVNRRSEDVLFRLITNIRNLINNSFYNTGYSKNSKTQDIIGCSFGDLKLYIESKFEPWMNWNNRGLYNGEINYGWDIDHIMPVSEAETKDDLIMLNHYSNLQPLCSKINRDIKKNNIEYGGIL